MTRVLALQEVRQLVNHIGRTVVTRKPWSVADLCRVTTLSLEGQLERVLRIFSLHGGAQLPGDYATTAIIQDDEQIHSAPANDLQLCKISATSGWVPSFCLELAQLP